MMKRKYMISSFPWTAGIQTDWSILKRYLIKAKHTFCVDHHISNIGFADVNHIVPEASSTSELVYGLLDEEKISQNVAEALYLGLVHDTGVFQYSCAGPETFRVAANLLEKGIDGPKIIEDTFYAKSYAQNLVMGRALMESILFLNGTGIASYIRKDVMDFTVWDQKIWKEL